MDWKTVISVIVYFLVIAGVPQLKAESPDYFSFTHYKSDAGLPHQQISTLAFDHDGMLWIGTRNGLSKYDGYDFRNYYHVAGDESSIPHNFINIIFVDSDNNIWIGSEEGLCRYDREKDTFRKYDVEGERIFHIGELRDGSVICTGRKVFIKSKGSDKFSHKPRQTEDFVVGLAISPDNRIFMSTYHCISSYDSDMTMERMLDKSLYSDFIHEHDVIMPLFFDHNGILWIGRDGKGVMSVNLQTGMRTVYDYPVLSSGIVRCITEDSEGMIWIGTEKGVNMITPASGEITSVREDSFKNGNLSDNAIYDICFDSSNNIWIATYFGGVNMMKRSSARFHCLSGMGHSNTEGKVVRRIIEPTPGTLWLASEDGGVFTMDLNKKVLEPMESISGLGSNVHELYLDTETSDIWIGTFRNGLFRYNPATGKTRHYTTGNSNLKSNAIFAIVRQKGGGGKLWIASTAGLMYYDSATDSFASTGHKVLDTEFVYCMMADSKGNLWAGTVERGLYEIDGKSGEIKGWMQTAKPDGLCDNYITTLCEDGYGNIFIGTNNSGLQYLNQGVPPFRAIEGWKVSFGTVCHIFIDDFSSMWVTTSGGLFKMGHDGMAFTRFTTADGLPENQFNFSSGINASDGKVYCGTVNGLVSFERGIAQDGNTGKNVHLWSLSIKNDEAGPGMAESPLESSLDNVDELTLNYSQSRLFSINYGIIDAANAKTARYQVLVDGLDKEWRDMGFNRQFSAMEMPPGNYVFKVRSVSGMEDWENAPIKELRLHIKPPFYMSSMAWIVYAIVFMLICYAVYRLVIWRIKSQQKTRLDQLEREKKDELNKEKMEFFTNISHELKTPLSLILAPLKQLSASEALSEDSKERLSMAIANTSKMVGLINELVTFNRVESGNFQLYIQKGNPLLLVEVLTGYFAGPAAEKDITINVMTRDNGEEVWFSSIYLERILSNLLSNAIKYTGKGGIIDVRASIEEGEGNRVLLQLEVKDNGIGIAPEEQGNIFKKYYQTKRGYSTSKTGSGIGLATVKKLIEMHHGTIAVKSVISEGSIFTVKMSVTKDDFDPECCMASSSSNPLLPENPIITSSLDYGSQTSGAPSQDGSARTSMLIVEDNESLLKFLSKEFSRNYNVFTATNGVEALEITSEYPIDIVVSDVMMPEMDGIELCEHLKNDLATSHIPVILLTAKSDEASTVKGFLSGAEAYVSKPFDPHILELRVKNILRARRALIKAEKGEETISESDSQQMGQLPPLNKFDNEFISQINSLIDKNIDNSEFSVADVTKELGISRSLLHIKMKSFFNSCMTDYLRKRRMKLACELLKSGYNVSETAYRTGYSDPNYFTKVFKKEFGIPPKEYIASSHGVAP